MGVEPEHLEDLAGELFEKALKLNEQVVAAYAGILFRDLGPAILNKKLSAETGRVFHQMIKNDALLGLSKTVKLAKMCDQDTDPLLMVKQWWTNEHLRQEAANWQILDGVCHDGGLPYQAQLRGMDFLSNISVSKELTGIMSQADISLIRGLHIVGVSNITIEAINKGLAPQLALPVAIKALFESLYGNIARLTEAEFPAEWAYKVSSFGSHQSPEELLFIRQFSEQLRRLAITRIDQP